MSTVKISELESASSVGTSDVLPIVQDGETKKVDAYTLCNSNKNIITASITNNYTIDSTGYKLLSLNTSVSVGNKFTLSNDGAIVIGAGVTKVLVSAKASFNNNSTTGLKWLTIFKNTTSNGIIANPHNVSGRSLVYSTPTLIEVAENDKLYLGVNGAVDDVIRSTSTYTNITVEVID